MISIEHLSKIFPGKDTVQALSDISLQVDKGDIFGVIGMSGAGKSTLLRTVALLEQPTSGHIYIDGKDPFALPPGQRIALQRQIGMVFQGYNLLMQRNVSANIAFPLELTHMPKPEVDGRVRELLALVGLNDKARAYPSQLSGGQKQRVAIARALANRPKILLCDEPTSALDALTTRSILDLLKQINRDLGVTILIITHEISVIRAVCNKVAVIDNSVLLEQGETASILAHPKSSMARQLLNN
jgi:D-methionine transport system ATP-binding protein